MDRVMTMPMLDDEEYKAMMDLIKNSYLDTDPKAWKDLTLGMYDEYKSQGKKVPIPLLQALTGEPWVALYIPATQPLDDRPWGPEAQTAISNILASHVMPFYYLLDENNGNVFITIVLGKDDCKNHGVSFEEVGKNEGEIGTPGPNSAIPFPVGVFYLSEKENERYFNELIAREIDNFGYKTLGFKSQKEADKWMRDHPYDEKKKASRSIKDFFNR